MKYRFPLFTAALMTAALLCSCAGSESDSQTQTAVIPKQTTTTETTTEVSPLSTLSTIGTIPTLATKSTADPVDRGNIKVQRFDPFIESLGATPLAEAEKHIGEVFRISGEVIERSAPDVYVLGSDNYPAYQLEFRTEPGFAADLPKGFELGQGLDICGRLTAVSGNKLIFERAVFCGWSRTPQTEDLSGLTNTQTFTRPTLGTYYTASFPKLTTTTKTETKIK